MLRCFDPQKLVQKLTLCAKVNLMCYYTSQVNYEAIHCVASNLSIGMLYKIKFICNIFCKI